MDISSSANIKVKKILMTFSELKQQESSRFMTRGSDLDAKENPQHNIRAAHVTRSTTLKGMNGAR